MPRLSDIGGLYGPVSGKQRVRFFPAMALLRPTAAVVTGAGSSATIGANGSVTFSAATTIRLDGIFTSQFDSYQVIIKGVNSTGTQGLATFFSSGGTVDTSATYNSTVHNAFQSNAGFTGITDGTGFFFGYFNANRVNAYVMYVFGPALAQNTTFVNHGVTAQNNADFYDSGGAHLKALSYDGLRIGVGSGTFGGTLQVFGFRNAP